MVEIDDLLQRRPEQILVTPVARLAHHSFVKLEIWPPENHKPLKPGIPNRKKTGLITPLSCKLDYSHAADSLYLSVTWAFFTGN